MVKKIEEGYTRGVFAANNHGSDAFGRLRVALENPQFDSKQLRSSGQQDIFWESCNISGTGGTTTFSAPGVVLSVAATTAGTMTRTTKAHFNYQPGKSMYAIYTANFRGCAADVRKCGGMFTSNNGLFFELDGNSAGFVRRTDEDGTVRDTVFPRQNWNIDKLDGSGPSEMNIDFSATQIYFIDYEWLGSGRVRYGVFKDGVPIIAHEEDFTNVISGAYMQTPNLPFRFEISNNGDGGEASMVHYCHSVMAEGGAEGLPGTRRYISISQIDPAGVDNGAAGADVLIAVMGWRLQASITDAVIFEKSVNVITEDNANFEWMLMLNPTVAGLLSYTAVCNTAIEFFVGSAGNSVTSVAIAHAGGLGAGRTLVQAEVESPVRVGNFLGGGKDIMVLGVRSFTNNSVTQAGVEFRELQ